MREHMTSNELYTRWKKSRDPVERRRWHALYLLSTGRNGAEVGRILKMTRSWVSKLLLAYNTFGSDWAKVTRRPATGRKLELTCDELEVILDWLRTYTEGYRKTREWHKINIKALVMDIEDATGRRRPDSTVRRHARLVAYILGAQECVPGYAPKEAPSAKQRAEISDLAKRCREGREAGNL